MYKKLIRDFKCNQKIKQMKKKECIKMIKKEFNNCIKDKALEVKMTHSIENPVVSFKFFKKEKLC